MLKLRPHWYYLVPRILFFIDDNDHFRFTPAAPNKIKNMPSHCANESRTSKKNASIDKAMMGYKKANDATLKAGSF